MDGCVGRAEELKYLADLWEKVPVSCAVCGRRHLGKTALLREFAQDKRHIYITGTGGLRSDNLEEINRALSRFTGKRERISDIDELCPKLRKVCGHEKVLVVIDRFSDLEENFEEIGVYIRGFINREMGGTRIMLVVCDSDSSVFGRFYYTLDLKTMSYLECRGFHPGYTAMQQFKAYAVVGGTPAYHRLFHDADPDDVIREQMFNHMSALSLEAEGMVSAEATTLNGSTKVLAAIAGGAESVREISNRTGLATSFCTRIVDDMEHKGLLSKEVSSGISRRAVYSISSNILAFYHQVVYRYMHMVEFESPEVAYEAAQADIAAYMESKFKSVCMDYVTSHFDYKFIGKLRRKDDSVDDVIDFLASVSQKNSDKVMVARCRLAGEPFGKQELDELIDRAKKVDGSNKIYLMFSGAGFSPELKKAVIKGGSVKLLTLDDVYEMS